MDNKKLELLQDFFGSEIEPKEFAKCMRRVNYVIATYAMNDTDTRFQDWVSDGYYWLNSFVEKLDPVIEDN